MPWRIELASRLGMRLASTVEIARLLCRVSWAIQSSSCCTVESGNKSMTSSKRSAGLRSDRHRETFMLVGPLQPLCVQRNPPRDSRRWSLSGLVSSPFAKTSARTNTSSRVSPLSSCTLASGDVNGVNAGLSGVTVCPMPRTQAYPSPVVPHPL